LESSTDPKTTAVDDSYFATNYSDLMAGESPIKPGWQLVHAFRKVFGPVPADQSAQPWMIGPPPTPTISDTKQIVRDSRRKQLSFAAPKTEGFSGYLDGKPIANLAVLDIPGSSGFASVIVVALDDKPLAHSKSLLVSRTFTDAAGSESPAVAVNLHGLTRAAWRMRITRPIAGQADGQALETSADGIVTLPESAWNECELDAK